MDWPKKKKSHKKEYSLSLSTYPIFKINQIRDTFKNSKDFRILPNENFNSGVPSLVNKHSLLSSRQWMQVLNLEKGWGGRLGEILDRFKKSLLLFYFLSPLLCMKYWNIKARRNFTSHLVQFTTEFPVENLWLSDLLPLTCILVMGSSVWTSSLPIFFGGGDFLKTE